ncbi:MAG: copper resistance protein [Alphaproteobacteria bacterium]|jgi:methionine-rich copper-binding protein CopC|nr:copper resistance protein [Alphaproteobacteria bacterium]
MKTARTFLSALSCAGIILAVALLLAPVTAFAHASLVKSAPAQRAAVFEAPPRVELWFNERLESKFCSIAVTDVAGKSVDNGDLKAASDDPKQLSIGLGKLGPGVYTVKYRVLSVDGHVVENNFTFTVRDRQ